jgi:hypothetical protein
MSVLLLILGIVVAAAGVAVIGFSIPLNEFTLISAGATALTGGLMLIGLSAVVSELARLAEGLKRVSTRPPQRAAEVVEPVASAAAPAIPLPAPAASPPARPPAPNLPLPPRPPRTEVPAREPRPTAPYQPSPSSVEVSAAAIERLRSTIPRTEPPRVESQGAGQGAGYLEDALLSPNGAAAQYQPGGRARAEPAAPEPRVAAEDRAGGAVEALKASRLDFLFRSKSARPQPQNFEAIWPADARPQRNTAPAADAQPTPAQVERQQVERQQVERQQVERQPGVAAPIQEAHPAPPAPEGPPPVAILKSGVVDGMAYTLYTDGSIEAKLPQGTVRFGSVAELRSHIESNS